MSRVLIVGLARSGTTWLGQALSGAEGTSYVDEPDNHYRHPSAFRAKATLPGRAYPILHQGDSAPEYASLWEEAFDLAGNGPGRQHAATRAGGATATALHRGVLPRRLRRGRALVRRSYAGRGRRTLRLTAAARLATPVAPGSGARDVVVKSVYAARCVEWLAERLPVRVLILRRGLHGVVASWKAAGWLEDPAEDFLDELGPGGREALAKGANAPTELPGLTQFGRVSWLLACLASELRAASARHPDWLVASYEDLVGDAARLLPELAGKVGVAWSSASEAQLRGPLAPPPRPPEIDPRLTGAEAAEITSVLDTFDLRGWAW